MKTDCGSSPESLTDMGGYLPTENLFTKEQVEGLLKKQRVICADIYYNPRKDMLKQWGISNTPDHLEKINNIRYEIINAPSPLAS